MFKNTKLSTKIIFGYGLLVFFMIIIGFMAIERMGVLAGLTEKLYKHPLAVSNAALAVQGDMVKMHRSMKDVALAKTVSDIDTASRTVGEYEKKVFKNFEIILDRFLGDKSDINKTRQIFSDWKPIRDQVISLMKEGYREEAAAITSGKGAKHLAVLNERVEGLINFASGKADEFYANSLNVKDNANMFMIALLVVTIVASVFLGYFIIKSITKPVNIIVESLSETASQVNSAAQQLSQASMQISEGAAGQASSLEETSSSLEEMASMTKQNADNAENANSMMVASNRAVTDGVGSMDEMIKAMDSIKESSNEISKIIKVIEEIAFQTNLLALNAAVEAARAGEHGKGFAVVAEEVRNLAQRSANASKDTSSLIENAISKAEEGSVIVHKAADALKGISKSSRKVSDIVGEIAAASKEQSSGIDQVNQAVSAMDQVTQTNAATAEEAASTSEQMAAQSEQMKGAVDDLSRLVYGGKGDNGGGTMQSLNGHSYNAERKGLPAPKTAV